MSSVTFPRTLTLMVLAALMAGLMLAPPIPARAAGSDPWTWWLSPPRTTAGPEAARPDEMARRREELKNRQRRIIYNNDGDDTFIGQFSSVEEFLAERLEAPGGTQVDSVFYCPGGTMLYAHNTRVSERADHLVDRIQSTAPHALNWRHNIRMLAAEGTDCLEAVVGRAHEASLEVFFTHRLNDVHDSVWHGGVPAWDYLYPSWKRDNPHMLMGTPEAAEQYPMTSPRYWWSALDFSYAEVREHLQRVHREICRRYEVDGMELDYVRSPLFFRPNLDGEPATPEQLDLMTSFQRGARQIAEREGRRRGRPILVSARVPFTIAACEHVGIDIRRWLEEGLVDLLALGGGYTPFGAPSGMEPLVRLAQRHGVRVYPVLSASGFRGAYGSIEGWRGAASNAWRTGADGIYLFNHFPRQASPQFLELGDRATLAGLDKLFAIENDPSGYRGHFICLLDSSAALDDPHGWGTNLGVHPVSRILPLELNPAGDWTLALLLIGDDLPAAGRRGKLDSAVLEVQISDPALLEQIEVSLNGTPLSPTQRDAERGRLSFSPAAADYRVGDNAVRMRFTSPRPAEGPPVQITAVEAHVEYRP